MAIIYNDKNEPEDIILTVKSLEHYGNDLSKLRILHEDCGNNSMDIHIENDMKVELRCPRCFLNVTLIGHSQIMALVDTAFNQEYSAIFTDNEIINLFPQGLYRNKLGHVIRVSSVTEPTKFDELKLFHYHENSYYPVKLVRRFKKYTLIKCTYCNQYWVLKTDYDESKFERVALEKKDIELRRLYAAIDILFLD